MRSYTIAQTREERKGAAEVSRKAEIEAIRLVETDAKCKSPADTDFPLDFAVEVLSGDAQVNNGRLTVPIRFSLAVRTKAKLEVLSLHCLFNVDYALEKDFTPPIEGVRAFKEGNAIFNCWPYFREYAQNLVSRMNYPPLTVPFLRIAMKKPEAKTAEGAVDTTIKKKRKVSRFSSKSERRETASQKGASQSL